jgi:hypothetical protein
LGENKNKNMPNLYNNAGLEPDEELSTGEENIASLGFHADDDDVTDDENLEEEDDEEESDQEETDDEIAEAAGPTIVSPLISADDNEEDLLEDDDSEEGEDVDDEDSVVISKEKIILAKQLLENIQKNSGRLATLFGSFLSDSDEERINIAEINDGVIENDEEDASVVEGVFNGENMIGPDGKEYGVPANYASKSKLVEGDMLKLTITDRGTFLYKQTKPVERRRIIGKLEKDINGNYLVAAEHKKFRVITASITYYKGIPADKVVVLVPVSGDSAWAAVENVIKGK